MKTTKKTIFIVQTRQEGQYIVNYFEKDGKNYMSVPAVIMVEGVHNGSEGNILHVNEYLSKEIDKWDNIPVTINHPKKEDKFIGVAECPEYVIGYTEKTTWDNGLHTMLNLDVQNLNTLNPTLLDSIKNKQAIEVSIGAYSDNIKEEGVFKGEQYIAKTVDYIPDHVAILPDDTGACSYVDGCGIRVYSDNSNNQIKGDNKMSKNKELVDAYITDLQTDEFEFNLIQLNDDSFIYVKKPKTEGNGTFLMQTYTIEDDKLVIAGEGVEVEFKPVAEAKQQEEKPQVNKCCEQKVIELIANARLNLTKEDKKWLSDLTEQQLQAITPKEIQVNIAKEQVTNHLATYTNVQDVVEAIPEQFKSVIEQGLNLVKEQKTNLIKEIQVNTKNTWTDEELANMDVEVLKKIHKTSKPIMYVGAGAGTIETQKNIPALSPIE